MTGLTSVPEDPTFRRALPLRVSGDGGAWTETLRRSMADVAVQLTVNGQAGAPSNLTDDADFPAEQCRLPGPTSVAGGVCGACTVLVDSGSARVPGVAVQAEGTKVDDPGIPWARRRLSPVQSAFRAMACSVVCTPGFASASLTDSARTPTQ
jgi:aerobic-type carbon monoxide dehydrogenase small subunit (CoxS/CutS family)